jgi:flagellar basal-body rod modification protein FlgD
MTIAPTGNQFNKQETPPAPVNPKGDLGRETFMKLLVAELKNQDPMDPMQSREMVSQLAQLSSVEKLGSIDDRLNALDNSNKADASLQSAGLVGHTVTGNLNQLPLNDVNKPEGAFTLAAKADAVTIKVRNAAGELVRTIEAGAQGIGPKKFAWDGRTDKGMRAQEGPYTFEVSATDAKGNIVPASTAISGLVTEVTYESGAPQVVVGGARIPLGDITSIQQ